MAIILIVSRTKMSNGICIGGINEETCEFIRLHNELGANLSSDAPYNIGERWEMIVKDAWNRRPYPHVEDKQTMPITKINDVGIAGIIGFINNHNFGNRCFRGRLEDAFEGCLNFEGNKNFINRNSIPHFSTQFWMSDKDLLYVRQWDKDYYIYNGKRIKYVGFQEPVERIPAGTILRLSLANWWDGDGSGEDRCYLQLSGWYL